MKRNNLEFYDLSAPEWWNQTAKIYGLYYLNQPRFAYFDRYLQNWQQVQVLDIGCGGGFSCEFMAQRGAIVSGIDQSAACIEAAKAHASHQGLAIDYRVGLAECLPYPEAQFDCVVCVDVLEHVADLTTTIAEVARVLKPGGYFFFDTINRTLKSRIVMIWLLENILREIPQGVHDWNKFIPPQELTCLLHQAGLTDIEIYGLSLLKNSLKENFQAYLHYKRTGSVDMGLSEDISVTYLGKAIKAE